MTIQLSKTEEARILRDRRAQERREIAKARRVKSPKADRGRVRDNGYLAFLRRRSCLVGPRGCSGMTQACHIRFGDFRRGKPITGMAVKPDDRWALNLCAGHHAEQHSGNERAFWAARGIDALATAERLYAEYRSLNGVVSRRDGADKGGG